MKLLFKYKRIVILLTIIVLSLFSYIYLNDIEGFKNQLLVINTGILTGTLLSLLYLWTVNQIDRDEDTEKNKKIIDEIKSSHNGIIKKIDNLDYGKDCAYCTKSIRCFSDRDKIKIGEKFYNAKEKIYIFTTSLHYHLSENIINIENAAINNVDIKILVLKPTSMFVKIRYKELGFNNPKDFFDELNVSLRNIKMQQKELLKRAPNCKFEVKTHLHTPSFHLYVVDDELYFNPIVPLYRGRKSVHIYYNLKDNLAKSMAKDYINTFNSCWETASDVEDNYIFNENNLESLDNQNNN